MTSQAVIVDAVRSPMGRGKPGGALAEIHPVELLGQVLQGLLARTGIDPGAVEDVIVGCVGQAGEQSATPGRQAWLAAGLPEHVPSVTIDRKCGSGQQALEFAVHGVIAGAYDIAIAAGVESMSRVPIGSPRMGADPFSEAVNRRYAPGPVPQGIAAELVAHRWGLSREALDEFSARSHQRAAAAARDGAFAHEIVSVRDPSGRSLAADETIRADSNPPALAALRPAFAQPEWAARFPEIDFKVTAGSSSQLADGASALLVMSEKAAARYGLAGRARITASAVCGEDPIMMLTGPIPATAQALQRAGLSIDDIDIFEVNEAFAPVPLAWQAEFDVPDAKLNPRGGAIALGHPLGASGCRLMTTMINALEAQGAHRGLQVMCEAGGMANATIIERVS